MNYYFAKNFAGPSFEIFNRPHLIALALILAGVVVLLLMRRQNNAKINTLFRWSLAAILVLQELSFHLWNIYIDEWTLQKMLPLHICSVFVWLGAYMLVSKNRHIYEFAYFLGIAGALQAALTPDISDYGFPHYRFFHVFISHGSIIIAALYMTLVERYRPTWRSFTKVFLWLNIYVVIIFGVNFILGSNYMYVTHKPETASLLDALGPWPVYIIAGEGVALIMFLVLYLPFAVYDWRHSKKI